MKPENIEETVNEIFELYEKYGSEDYIGEPVSHNEQTRQEKVFEFIRDRRV